MKAVKHYVIQHQICDYHTSRFKCGAQMDRSGKSSAYNWENVTCAACLKQRRKYGEAYINQELT